MYKILQTGQNNQFGGLKNGLSKVVYHQLMALLVANHDTAPIITGSIIEMINFIILFIKIFS